MRGAQFSVIVIMDRRVHSGYDSRPYLPVHRRGRSNAWIDAHRSRYFEHKKTALL